MNINALMQQAQKMQKDILKKQEEIQKSEYTGSSQLVDVVIYGTKKIKSINFKDLENLDKEDLEMLEDMIKIAINEAISKVEADVEKRLGAYGKTVGGLF
jgi:DNA-binding YbaB/EbfC family protein